MRIGRLPTSKEGGSGGTATEGGLRVGGFKRQSSAYSKNRNPRSGTGARAADGGNTEVGGVRGGWRGLGGV